MWRSSVAVVCSRTQLFTTWLTRPIPPSGNRFGFPKLEGILVFLLFFSQIAIPYSGIGPRFWVAVTLWVLIYALGLHIIWYGRSWDAVRNIGKAILSIGTALILLGYVHIPLGELYAKEHPVLYLTNAELMSRILIPNPPPLIPFHTAPKKSSQSPSKSGVIVITQWELFPLGLPHPTGAHIHLFNNSAEPMTVSFIELHGAVELRDLIDYSKRVKMETYMWNDMTRQSNRFIDNSEPIRHTRQVPRIL